jgi:hypothetical protein
MLMQTEATTKGQQQPELQQRQRNQPPNNCSQRMA